MNRREKQNKKRITGKKSFAEKHFLQFCNLNKENWLWNLEFGMLLLHSVKRIVALITVHCNHAANTGIRANIGGLVIFTSLKLYLNAHVLIFSLCEGSSQPIANQLNMQKFMVLIFLTIKSQSLTHTVPLMQIIFLLFAAEIYR